MRWAYTTWQIQILDADLNSKWEFQMGFPPKDIAPCTKIEADFEFTLKLTKMPIVGIKGASTQFNVNEVICLIDRFHLTQSKSIYIYLLC